MVSPQLLDYIRQQLAAGTPRGEVAKALIANGWQVEQINEAFVVFEPPTAAPTPNVQVPSPVPAQSAAPRIHAGALVIAAGMLIVVGAAGVSAYTVYFSAPSPTEILQRALQNSLTVKTFAFTATSTGSGMLGNPGLTNIGTTSIPLFSETLSGLVDISSSHPSADMTVAVNASLATATAGAKPGTSTGSVALTTHAIYTGGNLYADITNFNLAVSSADPKASMAQLFVSSFVNGFMGAIENKWIQTSATSTTSFAMASTSPALQADLSSLRDYLTGMSYISSVQNVGTESINGTAAYHLKVSVQNGQQLVDLVQKTALDSQSLSKDDPQFNRQMADLSQTVTQKVDVDFWIGTGDFRVYRMTTSPIAVAVHAQSGNGNLMLTQEVTFGNYNQPLAITAPQGALTLQQILESIFGTGVTLSTAKTPSKSR